VLTAGVQLCEAWGSKAFVGYLLAVNALCSVACLCWSLATYAATLDVQVLYDTFWCGFGGGAAAIAVALHATKPNTHVLQLPFLRVRSHQLPLFIFLYHMLGYGVRVEAHSFAYTVVGAYCSWLYMRFFRRSTLNNSNSNSNNGHSLPLSSLSSLSIGDPRSDMALASFFPAPLQFVVATLGGVCASLTKPFCSSLRYAGFVGVPAEPFTPAAWTIASVTSAAAAGSGMYSASSSSAFASPTAAAASQRSELTLSPDVHDAARRRERARKALDERIALAGAMRPSLVASTS
jgi:hypothetical protein